MVELALQSLLVVLLLLTITWCVIVHHRLRRLRTDRHELEAFISALDAATARAEDAVRQMREANTTAESAARDQERRARQQSTDLARLVDNAVRVVKRLDAAVEQGATRVAELRTPRAAAAEPGPAAPEAQRRPVRARPAGASPPEAKAPETKAAETKAAETKAPETTKAGKAVEAAIWPEARTRQRTSSSAAADSPSPRQPRPVRREGQLGGLLHGDLREALEGLR